MPRARQIYDTIGRVCADPLTMATEKSAAEKLRAELDNNVSVLAAENDVNAAFVIMSPDEKPHKEEINVTWEDENVCQPAEFRLI